METIIKQQQNIRFRAVTIADLDTIVKLYLEQKTTLDSALTNQFGMPLCVAEWNNKIVGYSSVTITNKDDYNLNIHIDNYFSNYKINKILLQESELFFKNEWQNGSSKNVSNSITHLVNWLNNSNS